MSDLSAVDLDPQGAAPQEENRDLVPLVVDGDPETAWRTESYLQNFGPSGLKTGVGLVVDLGTAQEVRQVEVATLGGPTEIDVFVTEQAPEDVEGLDPVGSAAGTGGLVVSLEEAVAGRFVTVWLTSLPPDGSEFRGQVAEIVVSR